MARQFGKAHIHGLSGVTLTCSGYIDPDPNVQSASFDHQATVEEINDQAGNVSGIIGNNETIAATLECIPEGANLAESKTSAYLPPVPSAITLANFPTITIGGTADALNGVWFYMGGGRINALADGKWTLSLPIRRYPGITSGTIIS